LQSQPTRIFEETRRHSSKDKTADVRQVRYPSCLSVRHRAGVEELASASMVAARAAWSYLGWRCRLSGHPKAANEGHLKTGQRK